MSLDAMKQALEALERGETKLRYEAITALRAAIEQAQAQEPVAWVEPEFWSYLERSNCGTAYRLPDGARQPLYTTPPAAPVQEPVAWTSLTEIDWARREPGRAGSFWAIPNDPTKEIALYTAPRQWVGLTEEEVEQIAAQVWFGGASAGHERFAKLIEAKLKEKNDVLRSV
jgi:hypothetical protein